ncbi:HTH_Tnp_Tc3_2 domain-containing protein [Trichonephila clavipes]|uniref:HTH_Tnp_Tc3_2 domain-containing protein n=1 Tax=Trichonephila clavipes TaxID=2585209 RepID=A0A8X6SYG7_TRICX|nr:HTH_Tnp_Tc3_2 domain-containing protein [Trichonephila clavipes]
MEQRKNLDDFLRGRIIGRLECGRTQLKVSEKLGIAQSVISRLWQRLKDGGKVSRCYSTGRYERASIVDTTTVVLCDVSQRVQV